MKILITDILLRKSFDIHNIIRARHKDWTPVLLLGSPSLWARLKSRLFYGGPIFTLRKSSYEDFEADLLSVLKRLENSEVVYLPVEEDTTLLFYRFLSRHNIPNLRFSLPPLRSFQIARDKKRLAVFCRKEGIPVPEEFSTDRLEELASNFRPVVIKPKTGSGAGGIRYIEKREQLRHLDPIDLENFIVQEKIGDMNEIEGGFFLFDRGRLLAYYSHRRIRTYPPRGGVSVYSKIARDPGLKGIGAALLEKLDWSGLAMVEFMFDRRTGEHKVIEVNPRLWGSIILSEFSGAAFLEQYVNSCLGAAPSFNRTVRTDVFIRWFFPFDLFNYCLSFTRIKNFWRLNPENICYINWTYAPKGRGIIYMLFLNFNFLIGLAKKLIKH
jgi:hypothetical protein